MTSGASSSSELSARASKGRSRFSFEAAPPPDPSWANRSLEEGRSPTTALRDRAESSLLIMGNLQNLSEDPDVLHVLSWLLIYSYDAAKGRNLAREFEKWGSSGGMISQVFYSS